jgi:O-antigen/teichoic acid export membrane protein
MSVSRDEPDDGTAAAGSDAVDPAVRGLGKKTRRGLVWTLLSTVGINGVRVITLPILGRLLGEVDFGLVAAALTIVLFAQTVRDIGIGPALVQRKTIEREHVEAGFTFAFLMGLALTALVFFTAPLVARFYGRPDLEPMVQALSPLFLLRGIASIPQAMCRRELHFRAVAAIDFVSFFAGSALAVGLAASGAGPWSLVWGYLLEAAIATAALFWVRPQRFTLRIHWTHLKQLLGFGVGNTIANFAAYFAYQGDYMVVGNRLGAAQLGFYTRAYELMRIPSAVFSNLAGWVLFSAFSRIQDDPERLGRALRRGSFAAAVLLVPPSAALVVLAPEFVRLLLGSNWGDAVLPFQILAVAMLSRTSYRLGWNIARATGDVGWVTACNVIYGVMVIAGAAIGARWGITGVAVSTAIACVLNHVMFSHLALRHTTLTWPQLLACHGEAVLVGAATLAAVWPTAVALRGAGLGVVPVLLGASAAGVAALAVVVAWRVRTGQPDWVWLWGGLTDRLRGKRKRTQKQTPKP